jgi:hypothetical protein
MSKKDHDDEHKHKDHFDFDDALIAAAHVDAAGAFVVQRGFVPGSGVHVPGSGVYTFQLEDSPKNISAIISNATLVGGPAGMIAADSSAPNSVKVITWNAAGALFDRAFTITVFDLS